MPEAYYSDESTTLYLGDCLEFPQWTEADLLVTDPPYGINWASRGYGGSRASPAYQGSRKHKGIENDHDSGTRDLVLDVWGTKPGIVFGSPSKPPPPNAIQTLVWQKGGNAGVVGSVTGWRRDWEAIYLTGRWPKRAAARSSVLHTARGLTSYVKTHPHAKPVALMEALLEGSPNGVIADPFAGSGSTLIAARNLGRLAVGVEIDERYCEVIANRLQQQAFIFDGIDL